MGGSKQVNHDEALALAYKALAVLRKEGKKFPSITEIAARSGVARSTINRSDEDWIEFKKIAQKGLPLKRLTIVSAEIEEETAWVRRLDRVEDKFAMLEGEFSNVKETGHALYETLLAQLRKYVLLAGERPAREAKAAEALRENIDLKREIDRLKGENASLRLEKDLPVDVRPLSKIEVITACERMAGSDITLDALDDWEGEVLANLDDYFRREAHASIPAIVYVMCGNFASGKSRWISAHRPLMPGVNLYIDGPCHTAKFRKLLLRRIRKLSPVCVVACVLVKATLEECLLRNDQIDRVNHRKNVPTALIETLHANFEEVGLDEGFDQVLLPREVRWDENLGATPGMQQFR